MWCLLGHKSDTDVCLKIIHFQIIYLNESRGIIVNLQCIAGTITFMISSQEAESLLLLWNSFITMELWPAFPQYQKWYNKTKCKVVLHDADLGIIRTSVFPGSCFGAFANATSTIYENVWKTVENQLQSLIFTWNEENLTLRELLFLGQLKLSFSKIPQATCPAPAVSRKSFNCVKMLFKKKKNNLVYEISETAEKSSTSGPQLFLMVLALFFTVSQIALVFIFRHFCFSDTDKEKTNYTQILFASWAGAGSCQWCKFNLI